MVTYGNQNFTFANETSLAIGTAENDDVIIKHAGVGACHVLLKRREGKVKVECNNLNGFYIHDHQMHAKLVHGYVFKENTFDLYLGRSIDGTKWVDAPNTNVKVVFKFPPAPVVTEVLAPVVTRVLAPVVTKVLAPVVTKVLPPVPIFTPPVAVESVAVEEMGKKGKKRKA